MRQLFVTIFLLVAFGLQAQIIMRPHPRGGSGAGSTLTNGLIAFWNFDEPDTLGYDSVGSNHLTNVNTVMRSASGVIDDAGDFELDNNEYLSIDDNADLSFGDEDFTFSCWVNAESQNAYSGIINKAFSTSSAFQIEHTLYVGASPYKFVFQLSDGTNKPYVTTDSTLAIGRWQNVMVWYNADVDSAYICVNAGEKKRISSLGCYDGTRDFEIGRLSSAQGYYFDGLVDLIGIWGRCPQSSNGYAMADSIYNSGNGWCP